MNIVLADDHKLFREGISQLIKQQKALRVTVNEASNGKEALGIIAKNDIDLAILDINMPILDGVETAKKIKSDWPKTRIIMLTMHDSQQYIKKLMEIGVNGYLLKTTSSKELLECIQTVQTGENFFSKDVQSAFIESFNSNALEQTVKLTKREGDILKLICEEMSTSEMAEKLFISTHTVETHRKNLLSKTGSKNVAGLVKFAVKNKII